MAKAKWEYMMDYIVLDENGCSRIYTIDEIIKYGKSIGQDLNPCGNGAGYLRTDTDGRFQRKYNYVLYKDNGTYNYNVPHYDENGNLIQKGSGKVIAIQFLGYMTPELWELRSGQTHSHSISSNIRNQVITENSVCPVTGLRTNLECDHKDGRYTKTSNEITKEDLQVLCKTANTAKRTHCNTECKITGKRFDATQLGFKKGFIYGDENYDPNIGCKGCYFHDVYKFHQVISQDYKG